MKDKALFISSIIFLVMFLLIIAAVFSPLRELFLPFITSFMLCYLFSPLVRLFEKMKIKRIFAVLVSYILIFGAVFFLIFCAAPKVCEALKSLYSLLLSEAEKWGTNFDFSKLPQLGAGKIYEVGMGALKGGAAILVGAVAAFYMLSDMKNIKAVVSEFVPKKLQSSFCLLSDDVLSIFNSFFRGQLLIAMILFLMEGGLLFALKIHYAWLLGFIGGILDIIPYVGAFCALLLITAVTILSAPKKILFVIIGFFIIQEIENNIISPKISSNSLSIRPAAVVLTLYVGSFGGFWGILLSVPLFCVLKKILQRLLQSLI